MGRDHPGHTPPPESAGTPEVPLAPSTSPGPDHRAVFHATADGLALTDMDGRIQEANRAFCKLFGCTQTDLVGLTLHDLVEERTADMLDGRLSLLARGTLDAFRRNCRIRHPRGLDIWCALAVSMVRGPDGQPTHLLLQASDISDAKQVEQMMLTSDRRFRTIFNSLSEGFVETDTQGLIVDVNEPLCGMLGYGREELIGRRVLRFLDDNGKAVIAARMGPDATNDDSPRTPTPHAYEVVLRTKTGGRVDARVFATTLTDHAGHRVGATAIVLDVTEQTRAQAALRVSEQRYRTLVDSIQDGLVLIRNGCFEYVNDPFAQMLGTTAGDLAGRAFHHLVAPDHREAVLTHAASLVDGMPSPMEYETELVARNGRRVAVNIHVAATRDDTGQLLNIATVKDVTERRRIETDLRKLSWAVEHSAASVFITDANGLIEYVNPHFTRVTGFTPDDAVGRTPALLKSGETSPAIYRDMWETLKSGQDWKGELRNRRKDGSLYWEFTSISPVRNDRGEISHFVAVKEDVTGRKEAELLNWQRANFDHVTDLPNRVLYRDRLKQALVRAQREDARVAVMFIDLDRFKAVNDTLGHEVGDQVLAQVGQRLTACMRGTDTVARLGGDEFTAILPNPGPEKAITVIANRILEALRRPFDVGGGQQAFLGGSIGIAIFPEDGTTAETLLKNADQAMYRAKETGRNTYQFFTADMNASIEARLRLETDLRKALREGQFAVHFQSVVDAATRKVRGAEALVRWAHPVRGLVPPGEFLPVAEEIGLIGDLGAMVVRTACDQCHRWRESGHPEMTVSINISGRQIGAPDFLDIIDAALHDSGLPPDALELEVEENLLLADVPMIEAHLRQVADRGIRLTIDDFGTGYSSLQHLRRFPFSTLKVDRSFVHDVLESRDDAILVEAVIAMARKLGLSVVAEGVETEAQIDYLLTQYCDMFQGFLFGRPLPPEDFERML